MMRKFLLAASVSSAAALALLRGAPQNATLAVDGNGERGHFYHADGCEDCVFKSTQCGCQPAVEYLACVTKHCHKADHSGFAEKCSALSSKCGSDLDLQCDGPKTQCSSKFGQLATGGLGLSVTVDNDSGFCGPWGKCIGHVTMHVDIHNMPKPPPAPKPPAVSAAPAASPAAGPAAPAAVPPPVAAPPPVQVQTLPIWVECGIPTVHKADFDKREEWNFCQAEVKGEKADCKVPLFKELAAGKQRESYCVLTDGKGGKKLSQPRWTAIINVHEKKDAAQQGKKEDEKDSKLKVQKAKEVKTTETKVVKPNEQPGGSDKLPWMADKEKRAAENAKADAKAPQPEKAVAAKKTEKPNYGENESGLPYMKDKNVDKPAPPAPLAAVSL